MLGGIANQRSEPIDGAVCPFMDFDGQCGDKVFVYKDQTQVICPKGHRSPRSVVKGIPEVAPEPPKPPRRFNLSRVATAGVLAALSIDALVGHL